MVSIRSSIKFGEYAFDFLSRASAVHPRMSACTPGNTTSSLKRQAADVCITLKSFVCCPVCSTIFHSLHP